MTLLRRSVVLVALTVALSACTGVGTPTKSAPPPTPTPSGAPTSTPTPAPSPGVTSSAQAAALVFASDAHFAALRPSNAGLIGECCSYSAVETPPGYSVTINIGWGDCEAGCISHHTWQFSVDKDGTIALTAQQGDPEPPIPTSQGPTASVTLHLQAGPTCPVVRVPPQPGCEPKAVMNAGVTLRSPAGVELATATSNEKGEIALQLAPGAYYLEPAVVPGLMGTAPPLAFSVVGGETVGINVDYDTGIR